MIERYPDMPGFKDPDTSRLAAEHIAASAPQLREQCWQALSNHIFDGATADEIASDVGRDVLAIRPRFTELLAAGRIADTGRRRKNRSGRLAKVWRAIDPEDAGASQSRVFPSAPKNGLGDLAHAALESAKGANAADPHTHAWDELNRAITEICNHAYASGAWERSEAF
jgi:predicted ArsR family transcriptional regulator